MAHGKETPRQKMIGMMYLVLMAMLALNVSADVLNAFVLVDEGLTKTTVNFANKNQVYYEQFDKAAAENPVKAGPWKNKAYEVKNKADELYNYIQELKIEIIKAGDGEEAEAIHGEEIHSGFIQAKDNTDRPAEIMIGPEGGGKANDLKSVIDGYRDYLLSIISEEAGSLRESIEGNLNTHEHTMPDGEVHPWQNAYFEHLPLIGVITIMSAIQNNVRNAESETLNYLYQQIDAGSFKFNLIEPVVIPQSNYVVQGADYEASVFMAAFDTTQEPIVYIGQYDSTVNDDGTVDYEMVGELGRDYDTIPVEGGKGVYRARGSSLGDKTWGGIIALKRMDGTFTNKPFRSSYRVAPQALVVSPTKMNVFYQAVENPVEISVPGFPASSINAGINNGTMRGSGTNYTVIPRTEGEAVVSVSVLDQGVRKSMGRKTFRVRPVPDPIPTLAGRQYGTMAKSSILGVIGLEATMPDWFNFDLEFTITSFNMDVTAGGLTQTLSAPNYRLTNEMRDAIRAMRPGTNVVCTNIQAVGPDGAPRDLPPIAIKIR